MQQKVFEMVGRLYNWFNGDVVQISKAFLGSMDEIAEAFNNDFNDVSFIDLLYREFQLVPENVKDQRNLIEDYVYAHDHGMTLAEYWDSNFPEDIVSRKETRKILGIDSQEPVDANRIEYIIEQLHSYESKESSDIAKVIEGWGYLKDEDYGGIDNAELRKLQEVFAIAWVTPEDMKDWLKKNQISVDEIIELLDSSVALEDHLKEIKMQQKVFEMVGRLYNWFNGDVVQISKAFLGSMDEIAEAFNNDFNDVSFTDLLYREFQLVPENVKDQRNLIEDYVYAHDHGMTLAEYWDSNFPEDIVSRKETRKILGIDSQEPVDANRIEYIIEQLHSYESKESSDIAKVIEGWGYLKDEDYGGIDNAELRKLQEVFAIAWVTPEDMKDWLKKNQISVDEIIELLGSRVALEDHLEEINFTDRLGAVTTERLDTPMGAKAKSDMVNDIISMMNPQEQMHSTGEAPTVE